MARPSSSLSSLSSLPRSHGEGDEGDEAGERPCQEGRQGDEGDEARERPCQEGRGGAEGDEARERHCQEGRGGAEESHEVSWRMSTPARPPRAPGGCASSDVWVSPHSRGAWVRTGVSRRARTHVAVYAHL